MKKAKQVSSVLVEIYSKPDCHLCEIAKTKLMKIQAEEPFDLREIDISRDGALLNRYYDKIPLVFIEGQLIAKYFIDKNAFLKRLQKVKREKSQNARSKRNS